jgi:hypothetical protein
VCAVEDCEPFIVSTETKPVARKEHLCSECGRTIRVGEKYHKLTGLCDGRWETDRTCNHCMAMSGFMHEMCGGYPLGELREELEEHWREGYASIEFGRLIACMRLKWHDGTDPIPQGTGDLAKRLMNQAVA